jgi:signal transduction histidine kinase
VNVEARSYAEAAESFQGTGLDAPQTVVRGCSHSVQFYDDENIFLEGLSEFLGAALGSGGACLLIATRKHRDAVAERLCNWGINTAFAIRGNRYLALDAEETLARFMVDGWPDESLFRASIVPMLERAGMGMRRRSDTVVAFGEMVAILCAQGRCEAALRLEEMWSELVRRHSFSLRCGYPMSLFADGTQVGLFSRICAEHSEVIPAESNATLGSAEESSRLVTALQQKTQILQAVVEAREREIAQRRQVEERLRRSEEFTKKVVESSVDGVEVLDLDGRLEYMSPPGQWALEIADIAPYLGRSWLELWRAEDRERAAGAVAAAKAGAVGIFQGDTATRDGLSKSWDVRITPALKANGEIERLIVISREVTAVKHAQMALMQAEKLATTGRLAATIAHEINNPLEAVTNFIYLAKTSPGVPEEVCRYLEVADQELARVAQIAQQTLGFYRDNSKHRWINVAELMGDVVSIYQHKLRYKQVETVIEVDAELRLYTRQGELKQALSNLIANAIDASHEGGRLWLRAHKTRHWGGGRGMEQGVRITLADNGDGMAPEVQQRIFVPFFTTKADVGTGIGLWMTKNLIEKQGGSLRFRSRQGAKSGTVMSCFLPLRTEECVAADLCSASTAPKF